MAKNKSSTALFDVIHAAKKPPKSSPSASIPAPRWWGKDKKPLKPVVAAGGKAGPCRVSTGFRGECHTTGRCPVKCCPVK
jgi:hypothetical protein